MRKIENLSNQVWLIANDKEAEYDLFCFTYDLQKTEESLQLFKNEAVANEKMASPFSSCGSFVFWSTPDGQLCKVKAPNEEQAKWLASILCEKLGVKYADR